MAPVTRNIVYLPGLESLDGIRALKSRCTAGTNLLAGENGSLSPLSLFHAFRALGCGGVMIEIIMKNKSRDLVESYLVTASALGFSGAVLATGRFERRTGMPKPVHDLDTPQALRLALELKKEGRLRPDFLIGVRAPSGSAAAEARARYFVLGGADFIVLPPGERVEGLEEFIVPISEIQEAS